MTKFVVIAGAKGGVGRTTVALNLAMALHQFGRNVLLLDANLRTPSISIHLGHPSVQTTLHDVLKGKKKIREIAHQHYSGLRVIPAGLHADLSKENIKNLPEAMLELKGTAEVVIIDSSSDLGDEFIATIHKADEIIIVTTPELPAIADALKTIKTAETHEKHVLGIVLNNVHNDKYEVEVKNVEALLQKNVIGVIPSDETMREALHAKHPIVHSHPYSKSAIAFKKLAADLIGEKYVESIEKEENKKLSKYLLKRIGLSK